VVRPSPLTPGYRSSPYWWDDVTLPDPAPAPLPPEADVVVVGAGFTGLAAAWELARRGRHVVVLERDAVAAGASSRNGGMVHPGGKPSVAQFLGLPGGRALYEDTVRAVEALEPLCAELGADCDWRRTGHLELAHHPRLAPRLRHEAEVAAGIGEDVRFVAGDELADEIGSPAFAAALLVGRAGGLHPAKLATALAAAALGAGAALHQRCAVLALEADRAGHAVATAAGTVRCGDVVVATNGTTDGALVPWLGRRVLGIGSYILATEPVGPDLAAAVGPRGRMCFDTRNLLHYWRPSPDGTRILFGGRTSLAPTTVERARDRLYAAMVRIHPQLAGVRVARAWGGRVALTDDRLPHVGRHPRTGVVYAMGYCGSGVALALHLGRGVGRWLAGDGGPGPWAEGPWPRLPWAARQPALLPAGGVLYRLRDAVGC